MRSSEQKRHWVMKASSSVAVWLKNKFVEQITEHHVTPEFKWSQRDRSFYINSKFGLIRYRAKTERDLIDFRHKWANKFAYAKNDSEMASVYREILKTEKVKYRGTVRMRLELKWT